MYSLDQNELKQIVLTKVEKYCGEIPESVVIDISKADQNLRTMASEFNEDDLDGSIMAIEKMVPEQKNKITILRKYYSKISALSILAMKKGVFIVVALLSCMAAQAQSKADNASGPSVLFEARRGGGELISSSNLKFSNMEIEGIFGYVFSRRIALYVPITGTVGMFKENETKTYELATQLGLGLGYSPWHTTNIQLEIVGKAGSTLGGNWQYMYYDGGLRLGFPNRLYIGAGVRYFSNYKGDFGNHCNFYVALGGRLNFYKHRNGAVK